MANKIETSNPVMNTTSNVDPTEIEKFERIAVRWWDKTSEFKPLHDINPLRLNYINHRTPLQGKQVLDVGCGGGILAESMWQLGAQVMAIDMGDAPINVARIHQLESGSNVNYLKTSAEALVNDPNDTYLANFDIVTCMEMLEHVPAPESSVKACAHMVKPGGTVYFSTINRNLKSWLLAIIGAEYVLRLLPRGTHQYNKLIKPSELEQFCRHSNLRAKHMIGMHYNPITDHYWLAKGVDVNYIIMCEKL